MMRNIFWVLIFSLSLAALVHGQSAATVAGQSAAVDCDRGQSINAALSKLGKHTPATLQVKGTCTQYVLISGFEDLTVKGLPGATLVQPSTIPTDLLLTVLRIDASRSVLIDGFSILSTPSGLPLSGLAKAALMCACAT